MQLKLWILTLLLIVLAGCQSSLVPVSSRNLDDVQTVNRTYLRKARQINDLEPEKAPEVFVRRSKIMIEKVEEEDKAGSLFNLDNPGNYLFYDKPRGAVGDNLVVFVRTSRTEGEETARAAQSEQNPEMSSEQLEKELLDALPKLDPGEEGQKPKIVSKLNFKVMRKLPNGDAIVESYRNSKTFDESNVVVVQARVPRSKLLTSEPITTNDLRDVAWYQNKNNQVTERKSIAWEDEFTLRFSGFEEAKSRQALELEAKRRELVQVRERLQQRIINLGKERQLVVKERDRVAKMRSDMEKTIGELQDEINTRQAMIDEQKDVIKRQQEVIGGGQAQPPNAQTAGNQ